MHTGLEPPPSASSWLTHRLDGTLGAACDCDLDAHLLVCDACLSILVLHVLGLTAPGREHVPA